VFVADTLNFSFWSVDETKKYKVKYNGQEYTGYWSWIAALNRALDVSFTCKNLLIVIMIIFPPYSEKLQKPEKR